MLIILLRKIALCDLIGINYKNKINFINTVFTDRIFIENLYEFINRAIIKFNFLS